MLERVKVAEIELSAPVFDITDLCEFSLFKAIVCLHGQFIAELYQPVVNGVVSAERMYDTLLARNQWEIISRLLVNGLFANTRPVPFRVERLLDVPPMPSNSLTVEGRGRLIEELTFNTDPSHPDSVAIKTIDISQPFEVPDGLSDYMKVRFFVLWRDKLLGRVDIVTHFQSISRVQLCRALVDQLGFRLLEPEEDLSQVTRQSRALSGLRRSLLSGYGGSRSSENLDVRIHVSIVVGTYDRPGDLRRCLESIVQQITSRSVEIIVVDNHPDSGLTAPVVAAFPQVKLVKEHRQGVSFARNAGIGASTGEVVITVDDDVVAPPDWLEKLLAPFAQANIMAVTGNVLPLELETAAQNLFERYGSGGLARGYSPFEAGRHWFDSFQKVGRVVPTWDLGGTANSAFRIQVFSDPKVGLMDEALGPGMPSGVGEDIYLFYRLLKADLKIVYEPRAFVWHKHRREMKSLRRQLYNYSKGYVSYQLTTLLDHRDPNVMKNLLVDIPVWHMSRIFRRLRGRSPYPIRLILWEIMGHLAGPWSLWKSRRKVEQVGRSNPYIPPSQRMQSWKERA